MRCSALGVACARCSVCLALDWMMSLHTRHSLGSMNHGAGRSPVRPLHLPHACLFTTYACLLTPLQMTTQTVTSQLAGTSAQPSAVGAAADAAAGAAAAAAVPPPAAGPTAVRPLGTPLQPTVAT